VPTSKHSPEASSELARPVAAAPPLPQRLIDLFRLSDWEQQVLCLLLRHSGPLSVAELAEQLELELAETLALLGREGTLRARGLIEVAEQAGFGWLLPADLVQLGRGLHLWCNDAGRPPIDDSALFAGHAPGTSHVPAPLPDGAFSQEPRGDKRTAAIAETVWEPLGTAQAVLLWLGGVGAEQLGPLVQAVRARLQRPVVCVEAACLASWPVSQLEPAMRRLRRDADLRGAAVVVADVKLLNSAWRALCHPRPVGQTAPVILCSNDAPSPLGRPPQGAAGETALLPATASLTRPAPPASTAKPETGAAEDPAVLASREEARRRAALDAARAMGRPIPPELLEATRAPAQAAPPAEPAPKPQPQALRPQAAAAPPTAPVARAPNPRLAAALAKAAQSDDDGADYEPDESAWSRSTPPATPQPPAPAPAAAAPVTAAPPTSAVLPPAPPAEPLPAAAATALDFSGQDDDQPPLPLEEGASLDEVIRVARATPNNSQRIRILQELASKRSPAVIQLLRAHLGSPHPGVRAAAEAGMVTLFGANWNRSRPIPPPVQPPRSDDGGRGPGGAF